MKDSANDYTNLFALVDAVNAPSPEPYTSQTEGLADIEEMTMVSARSWQRSLRIASGSGERVMLPPPPVVQPSMVRW